MNPWLAMFQSVLPKAGALRIYVKDERCVSCGSYADVSRIAITKQDGMTGAIYLCEACIEAIKIMV